MQCVIPLIPRCLNKGWRCMGTRWVGGGGGFLEILGPPALNHHLPGCSYPLCWAYPANHNNKKYPPLKILDPPQICCSLCCSLLACITSNNINLIRMFIHTMKTFSKTTSECVLNYYCTVLLLLLGSSSRSSCDFVGT